MYATLQRVKASSDVRGRSEDIPDVSSLAAGCLFYCPSTGRILLVKRSLDSDDPGTWALLGGGIEEGESPEEGLRRELSEEACIVKCPELRHVHNDVRSEDDFAYLTYICEVNREFEPRLNHEHTDYQWCDKDGLPEGLHPCFEDTYNRCLINQLNERKDDHNE